MPRHAHSLILCSLFNKRPIPYPKQYKGNNMIADETVMNILIHWSRV